MRNFVTYEWLTIFTVIGLMAIVAAKFINTLRFSDFLAVIGNSKYLKIYIKEQKFVDPFDGFLFINLALSTSIFLFFGYSYFIDPITFNILDFLKILFAISTLMLIKTLLERLIGSLFDIDGLIDHYLFQKTTFKNYSGFVFLTANIFLLYTTGFAKTILITGFSLFCLINIIGFIISFKNYQKMINPNFFYFLLYLCALEIAPYVLLYKVVSEYNV